MEILRTLHVFQYRWWLRSLRIVSLVSMWFHTNWLKILDFFFTIVLVREPEVQCGELIKPERLASRRTSKNESTLHCCSCSAKSRNQKNIKQVYEIIRLPMFMGVFYMSLLLRCIGTHTYVGYHWKLFIVYVIYHKLNN